jgi:glutaredoxin
MSMKHLGLLMLFAGLALGQATMTQAAVPRPAPRINFLEDCRGRVTVMAFIVTSCPHCQAFSKVLEDLSRTKSVCAREAAFNDDADITGFARSLQITFPVLKIGRGVMNDFMGVPRGSRVGTPQIAVIDRAGVIQAQSAREGSPVLMQPEILRAIVDRLAKQ